MTGLVLVVLLGVTLTIGLTGAVASAFPSAVRQPVNDGVGDGMRVATLLRNPRTPPAADGQGPIAPEELRPLVDRRADGAAPTWWITQRRLPVDLQFAAGETGRGGAPIPIYAGRVLFGHAEGAPQETWAKDVEVWASLTPEQERLVPVGRWTLERRTGPQVFAFTRRAVWGLTLRLHTNYGHPTDTTLAEFALLTSAR